MKSKFERCVKVFCCSFNRLDSNDVDVRSPNGAKRSAFNRLLMEAIASKVSRYSHLITFTQWIACR